MYKILCYIIRLKKLFKEAIQDTKVMLEVCCLLQNPDWQLYWKQIHKRYVGFQAFKFSGLLPHSSKAYLCPVKHVWKASSKMFGKAPKHASEVPYS